MSITPTLIAGFEVYPSKVALKDQWIGGPVRESLSGKGHRKRITTKLKGPIRFDAIGPDEFAIIRVIWAQCQQGPVTIVDAAEGINGTFLILDDEFGFERLDGDTPLWSGAFTFREQ